MIECFTDSWDRNWIGQEVTLWLVDYMGAVRGILKDYGRAYVRILQGEREVHLNPAHIQAIIPPK